jgi:hypothetical protein
MPFTASRVAIPRNTQSVDSALRGGCGHPYALRVGSKTVASESAHRVAARAKGFWPALDARTSA